MNGKVLVQLSVMHRTEKKGRYDYQVLFEAEQVNDDFLCEWVWERGEALCNYKVINVHNFSLNSIRKRVKN